MIVLGIILLILDSSSTFRSWTIRIIVLIIGVVLFIVERRAAGRWPKVLVLAWPGPPPSRGRPTKRPGDRVRAQATMAAA
jgi:hypothetical protein